MVREPISIPFGEPAGQPVWIGDNKEPASGPGRPPKGESRLEMNRKSPRKPLGISADRHISVWLWYNKETISGRGRPPEERSRSVVVRKPVDKSS